MTNATIRKTKIFSIPDKDLVWETFRSGGPGGQKQNKTDSGARVTHVPSGAVAESREHASQKANKRAALGRQYINKIEQAGLGKAPYKYLGVTTEKYQACQGAPVQPGTSCDLCGTGIMEVHRIQSADGKTIKLGCDCIYKAFQKGDRVLAAMEKVLKAKAKAKRDAKDAEIKAELDTLMADVSVRSALTAQPHPYADRAAKGFTLLHFLEGSLTWSGAAGRKRARAAIKKFAGK